MDDPVVRDILRRAMVARIATLSQTGRPSITPLYYVVRNGQIWLGTADWTLAARHVRADPRASLLVAVERNLHDDRILRISGPAQVRTDAPAQRAYLLRVALKYSLTLGQIRNTLAHVRLLLLRRRYHVQSVEQGRPCVIVVTPEHMALGHHHPAGVGALMTP